MKKQSKTLKRSKMFKVELIKDKLTKKVPEVTFHEKDGDVNTIIARVLRSGKYYEFNVRVATQEQYEEIERLKAKIEAEDHTNKLVAQ